MTVQLNSRNEVNKVKEVNTTTVRCKFRCQSMTKRLEYGDTSKPVWDFDMYAVTDGSPENKEFFKYTPSGSLKVTTINMEAFEVGKEYYIDITPA